MEQKLSLTSPAFGDMQPIPEKYAWGYETLSGNNPPLQISGVDPRARSLALIMEDPDASPATWDHWVRFDIPPETKSIPEGAEPAGKAGLGTEGNVAYVGPNPPFGTHHYVFRLISLDTELDLPENAASKDDIERAMAGHVLQEATLTGLYAGRGIQ